MAPKAAKGKKVVNQDELRRLMRERQQKGERQKRVESPYAKYTSLGQLSCVLCNLQIKTDILWQAHVLGKQHKDKVSELKGVKKSAGDVPQAPKAPQAPQTPTLKRKAAEPEVHDGKKPRASASGTSAGLGLLAGHYDDDDDDDDDDSGQGQGPSGGKQSGDGLPADFFDSSLPGTSSTPAVSHSGSVSKAEGDRAAEKKDNMAETLPEGFFDDPVRDAKVRNVDTPKDHMDKEWEEFQKEIRQVSSASEAIVAGEDEDARLESVLDSIGQQIECLRKVDMLRTKQEAKDTARKEEKKAPQEERDLAGGDGEEEDEEEDEEELMNVLGRDWRAKGALA